jgi:PAS domain S-box-containing protein
VSPVPERSDATRSGAIGSTFEQFLDFVPDAIVGVGPDGEIVLANRQAEDLFGFERGRLLGETIEALIPERFRLPHEGHRESYFETPRTRAMGVGAELFALNRDGTEFPVEVSLSHLELDGRTIATAAVRDISERAEGERERALQDQLQRARRLESVGQLAGGIAHDFNNLLGVIMNYAEFVAEELEPGSQAHGDVEEIRRAAERAAALTRQLLIFSRRETVKPEVLDLIELIGGLENLLRRALGERVELDVVLDEELWAIEADPGQVEQVLVNLSVNARDAMPDGGRLLIEAENAELDDEFAYMHPDTAPGRYVRLKVSDTGTGMDAETVDRVFEPFYTTKPDGTGLGLATVYGIVTGAGGRIDIYSEPGIGTTVKVHMPATAAAPAPAAPAHGGRSAGRGEVVLVVEDETDVRRMAERILGKAGYTVIGATRGAEAVTICERTEQAVDLLLTDVIMPEMLGTELVERARRARPDLRVVYMSGYSHQVLAPQALTESRHSDFIEKPFNARALLKTVGDLLEPPASRAG